MRMWVLTHRESNSPVERWPGKSPVRSTLLCLLSHPLFLLSLLSSNTHITSRPHLSHDMSGEVSGRLVFFTLDKRGWQGGRLGTIILAPQPNNRVHNTHDHQPSRNEVVVIRIMFFFFPVLTTPVSTISPSQFPMPV